MWRASCYARLLNGLSLSALIICLTAGCGGGGNPDLHGVKGTVTLDGQPLETGTVAFDPEMGTTGPNSGGEIINGSYEIPAASGLKLGSYEVTIRSFRKTGRQIPAGEPAPPDAMVDEVAQFIPKKYNAPTTLRAEIKAGENTHDFALSSAN